MAYTDIRFPHLGIVFNHVGRSLNIGNFQIMYYGVMIALAFLLGLALAQREGNRIGLEKDLILDFFLWMVIPAIVGARIYYVVFSWDYYKNHLDEIINLRQGGLGVVGGISLCAVVLYIFCKVKKCKMKPLLDCICMGILVGQIVGRWGNFFNREAFGGYTDGLFAMQIPLKYMEQCGRMTEITKAGLLDHLVNVEVNGQMVQYIQVHPTFLYEGLWNLMILCIIFCYRKHKKFDGELAYMYMIGYAVGRFFIESLRVDQLTIGNTNIAATQVVCIIAIIFASFQIFRERKRLLAPKTDV